MEVKQVAAAANHAFKVATGQENIIAEDLSNIATAGKPLITSQQDRDNFVGAMADQIGRIKFVDREKTESAFDDIMRDGWEYGSVLEKVSMKIPEAVENDTFDLVDGASYDQDIVRKPDVKARFWNQYTQFDIDITKPVKQINSALNSARQYYGFFSMLDTQVSNGAHKYMTELCRRTVGNMTAETMYTAYGATAFNAGSFPRARNLLYEWNHAHSGNTLTVSQAMESAEFLRFASVEIAVTRDNLMDMTNLLNIDSETRFTNTPNLHVYLLSPFARRAEAYLYSGSYHDEFVRLPKARLVSFWQGTGTTFAFNDVSALNVTTSEGHSVNTSGILGVLFDHEAVGVCNDRREVDTHYNGSERFYNFFYHYFAGYFNAFDENFVVFFVA